MEEKWKDILGYEGLYQISNLGRVKSLERTDSLNRIVEEKILKPRKDKGGYLMVNLSKDGKLKTFKVHRLVALHFLPNPNNYTEVNHIDENKENNAVSNLEWCDRKYNINYGTALKRSAEKQSKQVIQYDLEGNEIARFPSTIEIERQYGFSHRHIGKCCLGKYKTAYHYKWQYA